MDFVDELFYHIMNAFWDAYDFMYKVYISIKKEIDFMLDPKNMR